MPPPSSRIDALIDAYEKEATEQDTPSFRRRHRRSIALVMLVLMVKSFNDEGTRRSGEAEQRWRRGILLEATQGAILRLMNEMGDLADGD